MNGQVENVTAPKTGTYSVDAVLSAASGKMLCDSFSPVHEVVTDVAGWPVMTHHMANRELVDSVAARIIRQVPWMPGAIENMPTFSGLDDPKAAVLAYVARIRQAHGDTVTLKLDEPLPALGLFDGFTR